MKKLNKFALTLTAAALLPTFAYAGTDEVAASFERDLYREPTTITVAAVASEADPLDIINSTLNKEPDAVFASFERSIYHKPTTFSVVAATTEVDPLVVAINAVLWSEMVKPVMHASITNSHSHHVR
ncbi:MAG TPA: hypothetical protein VMW07_02850 [Gallionella sp.]|jgi:hypothetical protein|nr:hypothetical protein [Gallionella sp.]